MLLLLAAQVTFIRFTSTASLGYFFGYCNLTLHFIIPSEGTNLNQTGLSLFWLYYWNIWNTSAELIEVVPTLFYGPDSSFWIRDWGFLDQDLLSISLLIEENWAWSLLVVSLKDLVKPA